MQRHRLVSIMILVAVLAIALICFAWQMARIALPWHPVPNALPTPQAQTHILYLPTFSQGEKGIGAGTAGGVLDPLTAELSHNVAKPQTVYKMFAPLFAQSKLGMGIGYATGNNIAYPAISQYQQWFYFYGMCDYPCTPSIEFIDSPLTYCPPVLLVFTEPGTPEPAGHPIDPIAGAARSREIRAQCGSQTKIIAGNVQQDTVSWLDDYIAAGGQYDLLGLHCYSYISADECINKINAVIAHFAPTPICLTEWSVLYDSAVATEFPKYAQYIFTHLSCSAVFTPRQTDCVFGNDIYGHCIDTSLIGANGELTDRGKAFVQAVKDARTIGY